MYCNGDCEPDLLVQHQCLSSQVLHWMNVQKFSQKDSCWKAFSVELLFLQRRSKSISMSMYLECSVINVPVGVMVRCPNTFVHIAYIYLLILCGLFSVFQRIAGITAMLQQSLEGLLIQGLQTSNIDIVRHCLRTYATIDKTRDAEALVGQVLVKPYMDEVIWNLNICNYWHCCEFCKWESCVQIENSWTYYPSSPSECRFPFFCQVIVEQLVKSNPNGLKMMYSKLLDFVPHHCRLLREVTGGAISRYACH